ncbi:MAG: DUF1822 family protein [Leptolyngbya sp. SIO1D8]|nr:DUF1822 family protein [Leptolyngbya sp. SIO1D8]
MSHSPESPDFEFDPLQSTTVTLPPAAVDWAIRISQLEATVANQWPTFLRALALRGFQQWVEAGALDVAVYYDAEQVPPTGINCRVGGFRLCLIPQGNLSDEVVRIPRETLDDSDHCAHLYVLVDVQEEEDRVTILSSLRRDRLLSHQPTAQRSLNPDDTYTVPVHCFDASPEDLLLYLNCLNPDNLMATVSSTAGVDTPVDPSAGLSPIELISPLGDELINVGRWLRDQIDEVANRLAWTLLPPMTQMDPVRAIRSPVEEIRDILTEISPVVTVPPNARGAYTDYQPFGLPIRLYALTWPLLEADVPEWTLLLCLGPSEGCQLPPGIQLRIHEGVSEATANEPGALLVGQTLAPDSESTYLYGQVVGTWDEQFVVTIELPNGTTLNWPPFIFQLDA